MATYAIGDIQGCFRELITLLDTIQFDKNNDILWFTGDLVNRGPQSLEVLRFIKSLGDQHVVVLGNHDLHMLAVGLAHAPLKKKDTLTDIFESDDSENIMRWLITKPLLHIDEQKKFVMTHAGIAPCWTLQEAAEHAKEVENILQSTTPEIYLDHIYGNQPDLWEDHLQGAARLRCITNYLTRMRYCYADGRLDLQYKGTIQEKPAHLFPWFLMENRKPIKEKIIFGHWAALNGKTSVPNLYALDTGCVWGHALSALRLEDEMRFSVACSPQAACFSKT